MDAIYGLIVLVLGFGAGFSLGRTANTAAKKAKELAEELKTAQGELDRHRQQVNEHFTRTGELVNNMTESYRSVYDHLAKGARSLCSGDAARITMITPAEKLIGNSPAEHASAPTAKPERAATAVAGSPEQRAAAPPKPGAAPAKLPPETKPNDRSAPPVH
ncbi:MAG: hypothetical protein FD165_1471 [Gammaproteobacteria bacterium]|nr:MAG: hypothetical protein FD165_1471 [Gammaproteobacteria bacterium]TND03942.1 MAG: hypothetical protein FD120_1651 [Gammaproteobacteria bacterium]